MEDEARKLEQLKSMLAVIREARAARQRLEEAQDRIVKEIEDYVIEWDQAYQSGEDTATYTAELSRIVDLIHLLQEHRS